MGVLRAPAALPEDDRGSSCGAPGMLSAREAARIIGCSPAAYRVRPHRACKRLKQARAGELVRGSRRGEPAQPSLPHVRNSSEERS
ncbi:hypothetical protein [Nonomuraea sp. NPDC049625]|uniref:hypothetical protein n=1 Tax=Nonomuraea sp. NPDC049625 TaxID=3155775 RepID=UPI00341E12C6